MNKTRKVILSIIILFSIISLSIFSFSLNKQLKKADNIIEQQAKTIEELGNSIQDRDNSINSLTDENEKYKVSLEEKETELKTCKTELAKKKLSNYRLTSYYPSETSNHTGSGLNTSDFQINEKGWYTYQGKLVLAAATTYLQKNYGVKPNKHYFKYYQTIFITIDNIRYEGIILDSCGACSYLNENRLDLFVSNKQYVIDRGYRGKNTVKVEYK